MGFFGSTGSYDRIADCRDLPTWEVWGHSVFELSFHTVLPAVTLDRVSEEMRFRSVAAEATIRTTLSLVNAGMRGE